MSYSKATVLAAAASLLGAVAAQDPAEGWMAYAVGTIPSNADRITRLEMEWVVSNDARFARSAFYSPWFGMDPDDNLNLIQPVNPWLGTAWAAYTEYFQWEPTHNSNSEQISVEAGQTLHGALVYNSDDDSYDLTQTVKETGSSSKQTVKCQDGKKYRIPYVVYEKTFPCYVYPPDGHVDFVIKAFECDGVDCTNSTRWETKVKDSNCDMTAHINSPTNISISWNTRATSKYDNMTKQEVFEHNRHGWAKDFVFPEFAAEI